MRVQCARSTPRCLYTTPETIYATTLNALRVVREEESETFFPARRFPYGPPKVRQYDLDLGGYEPNDGFESAAITMAQFLRAQAAIAGALLSLRYLQKLPGARCCLRTHLFILPDTNYLQVRECDMELLFQSAVQVKTATWEAFAVPLGNVPQSDVVNHQGQHIPDALFLLRATYRGKILGYVMAQRFSGTYSD